MVHKVAEYFQAGVEQVWVVLPSLEQVYIYASPARVQILSRTDSLHGEPVAPQFHLPLSRGRPRWPAGRDGAES